MEKCLICRKTAKFKSKKLGAFCSDECYEQAQLGDTPDQAHIVITRKSGSYFRQGDIRFSVNAESLEATLGAADQKHNGSCLDHLMDSQIASLAIANGIPVEPYVRELVCSPLRGMIQLVWYRDLENHTSDHLNEGQVRRIAEYKRKLAAYVAPEPGAEGSKKVRSKKQWSHSFRVVKGSHKTCQGREAQLLEVIKGLGTATFADIVLAADGKVKTKQKLDKIVNRFLLKLISKKAVEEVNAAV